MRRSTLRILTAAGVVAFLSWEGFCANWGLVATDTPKAWQVTKGTEDVVVAVIDTGIDLSHPSLKDNIWTNSREIPGNGVDDDGNGFVDDVHGWNFAENNADVSDEHGHGTHVAGIIAARFDGYVGGVAPNVRIMPLKYYSVKATGEQNLIATIKAIRYAVQMGAHIINYSAGGAEFSQPEFEAIKLAEEKGVLFIAAAGNEGVDAQMDKFYPAAYPLKNIIAVASLSVEGALLKSSNFGLNVVAVAAPGGKIQSTLPKGRFGYLSGTSQAAPFVTGTAALMLSVANSLTPPQVKEIVVRYSRPISQLSDKVQSGGIINTFQALEKTTTVQFEILRHFYLEKIEPPKVIQHQFDFVTL
jgi:subtilisin family serine protease